MITKSKKGKVGPDKIIETILMFIIGFAILGGLASTLITYADTVNNSGLPLASLFGAGGVVLIAFMGYLVWRYVKEAKGGR